MIKNRDEVQERICDMLAQGKSMVAICSLEDMPGKRTVYQWLKDDEAFRHRYARAREMQADLYADQIIQIADDCEPETAAIAKAKAQIDARKWLAARLAPKKYGDRLDVSAKATVRVETRGLADIFTEREPE